MLWNSRKDSLDSEISVLSNNIEERKKEIIDLNNQIADLKRYNEADVQVLKIRQEEFAKLKTKSI